MGDRASLKKYEWMDIDFEAFLLNKNLGQRIFKFGEYLSWWNAKLIKNWLNVKMIWKNLKFLKTLGDKKFTAESLTLCKLVKIEMINWIIIDQ